MAGRTVVGAGSRPESAGAEAAHFDIADASATGRIVLCGRVLIACALVGLFIWQSFYEHAADFKSFYSAGYAVRHPEIPLYDLIALDENPFGEVFKLAPTAAVYLVPYSFGTVQQARLAWRVTLVAMIVAAYAVLASTVGVRLFRWPWLVGFGLWTQFGPLQIAVGEGQWDPVLLLMVAIATFGVARQRMVLTALLIALAASVKPYPLALAGWFVARRQWRAVIVTGVASALLFGIGAAVVGLEETTAFVTRVLPASGATTAYADNQTLGGLLARWVSADLKPFPLRDAGVDLTIRVLAVAMSALTVWRVARRPATLPMDRALQLALFVPLSILVIPAAWTHYEAILLVPLTLLAVDQARNRPRELLGWLLLAAVYLVLLLPNPTMLYGPEIDRGLWLRSRADSANLALQRLYPTEISRLVLSYKVFGVAALYGLVVASVAGWRSSRTDTGAVAPRGLVSRWRSMIAERAPTVRPAGVCQDRLRVVGYVALALLALVGAWQLFTAMSTSPAVWHDFAQDYIAAEDALAGRNPFLPQNDRLGQLFGVRPPDKEPAYSFHPPTTIPFFLPLAPLPYAVAFWVWDLVQLACLWLIVDLTARVLGRPVRPLVGFAITLALVAVWPIRESFVEGQLNIPVAAGIVGCWYALRIKRPGLAGVALALAVALKPLAGLFVLWALWRMQWRLLAAAVVTGGLFAIVGGVLSGVQGLLDYVTTAYPLHAALWPGYQDNASPQGFFTRLFGPSEWRPRPPYPMPGVSTALTLASWAVAVVALFWRLGRRAPNSERLNREFAALGATMLLVTPIIWPHYYAVLVAPVAVFAATLWERRAWAWLGLLAAALVLLWVPRDLHTWLERLSLAPRAYGTLQLPGLLVVYAVGLACLGDRSRSAPDRSAITPSTLAP